MRDGRWSIRGLDPVLVRQLRVLAIQRDVPMGVVVNAAFSSYLAREVPKQNMVDPAANRLVTPPDDPARGR